jgi:pyruvate carboxylase
LLLELGPKKFAEWTLKQKQLLITDTTFRDAHQSLLATRVRTYDMLAVAAVAWRAARRICSAWKCGAARPSTPPCVSCTRTRGAAARLARADSEHLFPNALPRLQRRGLFQLSRQRVAGFVKHAARSGHGYFPHFRFAELHCRTSRWPWRRCRKRTPFARRPSVTPATSSTRARDKYSLKYYVKLARELEKMGAHFLAIKDMAGLCRPAAAQRAGQGAQGGNRPADPFPHARHQRHRAASVLSASEAGVDVVDLAIASMSGSTSQPNLNSIVAALQHPARHRPGFGRAERVFADYWEQVRGLLRAVRHRPAQRQRGGLSARNARRPVHQPQGTGRQHGPGQRWPEIARTYAEVNQLFGDIVKVTPSSKVVGDMTMFLITRGIKPADVLNLEPGSARRSRNRSSTCWRRPGPALGGWPKKLQGRAGRPQAHSRPPRGAAEAAEFQKIKDELSAKLKREAATMSLQPHHVSGSVRRVTPNWSAITAMFPCCPRRRFSTA